MVVLRKEARGWKLHRRYERDKETQEMLDFAAKHNMTPDVEVVPMDYVNTALECLLKSDVKYRFMLDVGIH
ncbi:hypothetical protein H5410_054388 [Solanum commersonii]|uniref:Alcohol dehydrogenase n=1 Tax=Solanum commersonii TaxID=4109 RepID=A0A9J5WHD6_SOLCO|nr:hypothetical protein H5410_054388 [Solanum commersonii]